MYESECIHPDTDSFPDRFFDADGAKCQCWQPTMKRYCSKHGVYEGRDVCPECRHEQEESDMSIPVPRWIVRSALDGDGYEVVRGEEVHWFRREEDAQVAATTFNAWAKDATDE
jgi:hypothetical protein